MAPSCRCCGLRCTHSIGHTEGFRHVQATIVCGCCPLQSLADCKLSDEPADDDDDDDDDDEEDLGQVGLGF